MGLGLGKLYLDRGLNGSLCYGVQSCNKPILHVQRCSDMNPLSTNNTAQCAECNVCTIQHYSYSRGI